MKAFLGRHPETVQGLTVIKSQPVSSGFGNSTFHSLNAFRLINSAGDSIPVRWLMTPEQPFAAGGGPPAPPAKNSLFYALVAPDPPPPLPFTLPPPSRAPHHPPHH